MSLELCYRQQVLASKIYRTQLQNVAKYLSSLNYPELAKVVVRNLNVADERIESMRKGEHDNGRHFDYCEQDTTYNSGISER